MTGAGANAPANSAEDVARALAIEEGDVLLPGKADHDAEAIFSGDVEKPAGRYGIDADGIDSALGHRGEVALDLFGGVIFGAIGLGTEGAVGYASDVEFFGASEEEFSTDNQPRQ